jgi:hypothetical protein
MTYEITLWQKVSSKKNKYLPMIIGGKASLIKDSKLRKELDALASQIPASMRNLNLEHPEIEVMMTVADGRSDRDNVLVTIMDLLVSTGVLRNDSIAASNGKITVYPAILSDHFKTVVRLTPTQPTTGKLFER